MASLPRDHNELSLDTIFRLCHDMHHNGKRIGFTHGTFDLFHYGHLEFLRESKRKCDFLLVGVECDENVQKYKPGRPVITDTRRREIIAELGCVSLCFMIRERLSVNHFEPYSALYKELKADVVTYGRDFALTEIQRVAERGKAKAQFIDTDKDSTTAIIRRIVNNFQDEFRSPASL